jgi:tetratricopeptide (TPR) repeat protein
MTPVLLLLLAGPPAGAVMVLPPTPAAAGPEAAWAGEVVADFLPRDLARLGVASIDRTDRLRAHEALAIPAVSVTRATSIRMAEALGVSRLVIGGYETKGASLSLSLRILDVGRGTLSAPLIAEGPPETLPGLVRSLAWDIALSGPTPITTTREAFLGHPRPPSVPLAALRAYGRALAARDVPARRLLLKQALAAASFDEARVALARIQVDSRDSTGALETLARVSPDSAVARVGRFLAGRAELDLGRYRDAAGHFAALSVDAPTAGVLNNYALALLRGGTGPAGERASDVLRKAVEVGPGIPEPPFNLGWALLSEGEGDAAAFWMRGVLREDARDAHARIVLVWSLRQAGHDEDADAEWAPLVAAAPSYEPFTTADLGRRFERVMTSESPPVLDQDRWGDPQAAASHLGRAEKLVDAGDSEGALRELNQAAYLDPYGARVHLHLARAHRARGDLEQALSELRMSLWCRDDPGVRAELAALLKQLGRGSEARTEAEKALKLDSRNADALRVLDGL